MQYSQVGFTTDPVDDRSTMYTSDVGTLLQEGGGLMQIEEPRHNSNLNIFDKHPRWQHFKPEFGLTSVELNDY